MTTKVPPAGFPPVFLFILALIIIGVVATAMGVKEGPAIITIALGATPLAIRGARR